MAGTAPEGHQRAHSARSGDVDRPPPLIVPGEKRLPVTIRAFDLPPQPGLPPRWEYDLWIVETGKWTGRLPHPQAQARLVAEGLTEHRARRVLDRARKRRNRARERLRSDQQHS
jgi:hypothetical protein